MRFAFVIFGLFVLSDLCGCTQNYADSTPSQKVVLDTVPQILPPSSSAVPEPVEARAILDRIWKGELQETTEPPVYYSSIGCDCNGTYIGGCSDGTSICVQTRTDGQFPKDIFVHELLHVYNYRHGMSDQPLHTNAIWKLQQTFGNELMDVPGVDREAQRTNICGKSLQECCTQGSECDSGLTCVNVLNRYLCTTSSQ